MTSCRFREGGSVTISAPLDVFLDNILQSGDDGIASHPCMDQQGQQESDHASDENQNEHPRVSGEITVRCAEERRDHEDGTRQQRNCGKVFVAREALDENRGHDARQEQRTDRHAFSNR